MRLERISDYEIKAYLKYEDIDELGIKDVSRLDYNDADVILGIAKAELDFSFEKTNCEIFSEACGDGYILTLRAHGNEKTREKHECVLCFEDEKALYTACVFLKNFIIKSSELRVEGGRIKTYYLILKYGDEGPEFDGKPYWLSSVSELCSSVHTDKTAFFYYISEHCVPLIEKNAVFDIAKSEKKW